MSLRFRLSDVLLTTALIACVLAWLKLFWSGPQMVQSAEGGSWQMYALLASTILTLVFGSKVWPNLVVNTGAVLLLVIFGLLGLGLIVSIFVPQFR